MRRKLVAGNWKMNGSLAMLAELDAIAAAAAGAPGIDVAVAVPATLIAPAVARTPALAIGAQDVHEEPGGAHTGSVSAAMVREAGAVFTIVGHSERRAEMHETDAVVKAKAETARDAGLWVILCVGETLDQRDAGQAARVVTDQLAASLPTDAAADWLAIAYEPVWAIGSGRTPSDTDVADMHGAIRAALRKAMGTAADAVRILYGGSVTGENAGMLLYVDDVDGALVGGASLTADKFVPIVEAAKAGVAH